MYLLFYGHHILYVETGLKEGLNVLGGTWDRENHYSLLQPHVFSDKFCQNF